MKRLLFLLTFFATWQAAPAFAANTPCAQIDQTKTDVDGMPFCPTVVTETSAYGVFRCALESARSFHTVTKGEKGSMLQLLKAWKANRSGLTSQNTAALLAAADNLNLQACRVKSADDSYLLVYTKPKVSDYSGPLMMLRETKASKFVIISPHDDSDGTHTDTKKAFAHSSALAMVSNGHKRGSVTNSAATCGNERQQGDMVHQPPSCNFGTDTIFTLTSLFNGPGEMGTILMHIHGMKNPSSILFRDRDNKVLSKAFEAAVVKATNIKPDAFHALNADFSIDSVKGWMLKTEMPARLHTAGDMMALARVVNIMEKEAFAWPSDAPSFDAAKVDTTPAEPLVWNPGRKPVSGKRDYICLVVKYSSGPSASPEKCRSLAQNVARFYGNQSRGRLTLIPKVETIPVSEAPGPKGASAAVSIAKNRYPNALFALPRLWYHGNSNAGGRVANLTGYGNSLHETGHLLGLGHCGRYEGANPATGDFGRLDSYGGGGCVMSGLAGSHLDPSQYLHLGWLEDSEWSVYDGTAKEYELRKISTINAKGGLMTVVVPSALITPGGGGRDVYVAYSDKCEHDPCIAVYFAQGGGSQRLGVFGKEMTWGPANLTIKNLGFVGNRLKIEISGGVK